MGFDWAKLEDVHEKMLEEIEELKEAERSGSKRDSGSDAALGSSPTPAGEASPTDKAAEVGSLRPIGPRLRSTSTGPSCRRLSVVVEASRPRGGRIATRGPARLELLPDSQQAAAQSLTGLPGKRRPARPSAVVSRGWTPASEVGRAIAPGSESVPGPRSWCTHVPS